MAKKRLDALILERMPHYSRQQVQSWIMQAKVTVNDTIETKPGTMCSENAHIVLADVEPPKYVSRAGFKLEHALKTFIVDVTGLVAMDAGLSTGGFTDCLLQHGIKKVYGVDVGYGQVHEKISSHPHVAVLERTNLREVRDLGEPIDIVTLDLSFISILKVLDAVNAVLKQNGILIALIKPQFEAQRHQIGRGGIIRDEKIHTEVVEKVIAGITEQGFVFHTFTESPITGTTGNKEFLAWFTKK